MNSKGIFNIELYVSLMMLLIIITMILSIGMQEFSSLEETQTRKEARTVTTDITRIINTVYLNGDNCSYTYRLPEKINNETYILQINATGVYLNSHYQMTYSKPIYNIEYQREKIILKGGDVYEFINNNNTIEINSLS